MKTKTNKKVAKKSAKKAAPAKELRETNPITGCKVGSKGNIVGLAMLSSKDPLKVYANVTKAIEKFFVDAGHDASVAHVRRHSIGWIDTLKMQQPKLYSEILDGVEYSKAYRASVRPVKAAKPKAEKKAKPAKKAKKSAAKKVKAAKAETAAPAPAPEAGAQL